MNLLDLMIKGEDPKEKALDRLEAILDLYEAKDAAAQDKALEQAQTFCAKEWGGYANGLELLASRKEGRNADPVGGRAVAARLRQEGGEPGLLIRQTRERRRQVAEVEAQRAALVARYGSEDQALAPSPIESVFISAAESLSDHDENGGIDPRSPLAGWEQRQGGDLPHSLRDALTTACPLPETIADARAEALSWRERLRELQILTPSPDESSLPTACAARCRMVEEAWAMLLHPRDLSELEARLEYWAEQSASQGVSVVLGDLRRLLAAGAVIRGGESTKDKARRLKSDNPDWSLAQIGKELGISRQAVHKHLRG